MSDNPYVISFDVPGTPIGKGRPRVARRGSTTQLYTPAKTASYEGLVALSAQQAMFGRPPMLGPAKVYMDIILPIPTSWSKKKQAAALAGNVYPTKKPDIDNVEKAIFDGMNGVVWADDVQAVEVIKNKRYGDTPCVRMVVIEIQGAEFSA